MTSLRFAPIIRVSTEQQERQGESLRTQTAQIRQYVEALGGVVPDTCWQYSGQEHATPGMERTLLERLLKDSSKNLFDAVIVCDASRWSRDNLKSKEGLNILKANQIRFYVGTMEYNLFSPEHAFYLGMSAEIGEYQAYQQALKSLTNRIEKAKRGIPTAGELPFGRLWDKKTETWSVDPVKDALIKQCAKRYLDGEGLRGITQSLGVNLQVIWRVLNRQSGSVIIQHFHNKRLNLHEDVPIPVPALLDDATIEAIHKRAKANKTYHHGQIKNDYLLGRMIFCAKCGYALFGSHNTKSGKRFYRHPTYYGKECKMKHFLPAEAIENSVLIHLAHTVGDPIRMQEAVARATPNIEKRTALKAEKDELQRAVEALTLERNRLITSISKELITDDEAKDTMNDLRQRQTAINTRTGIIDRELLLIPDLARVSRLSDLSRQVMHNVLTTGSPDWILKKPYDHQRKIIENAFGGVDHLNRRLGVYIEETGSASEPFKFEIRGILEPTMLSLPLPDQYLVELYNLDDEYQDVDTELEKIRKDLGSSFTPR